MKHLLFALLFINAFVGCFAQSINNNDSFKLYIPGYKNVMAIDSSRIYKPATLASDRFHFRPIEIDVWYPSMNTKIVEPIKYGEFISLLQQRSNRFQDDTVYNNLTNSLVEYICANLNISDTSKLLQLKTNSQKNALEANQKLPLIIYMCAFNGMSYENINLFEYLASHGYVVACITSVGRYPGNMSTKPADLMEQMKDGEFAINYLKSQTNIDSTKIGTLGYSWGSLAALHLAMNNGSVQAILSLDGSEMHYYGESDEEDKDFDDERNGRSFNINRLNVPYLYLESGDKQADRNVDSIFNFLPLLTAPKLYLRFIKAVHEDFSVLPSLPSLIEGTKNKHSAFYESIQHFALSYFDNYLNHKTTDFSAQVAAMYQKQNADSVYPKKTNIEKASLIIKGKVTDKKNAQSLSYANIGIPGKNIGTVAQQNGDFIIAVSSESIADSIRISMAGYQSALYSVAFLLKQKQPVVISLIEKPSELKDVIVTAKAAKKKILGNTTASKFISFGFPLKFLGSEIGIKIRLGKKPVLLKDFKFTVADNRLDSAVFRLNIYNLKNGLPFENIMTQNIFVSVGKRIGSYSINLSPYHLIMKDDIFIALEWVEGISATPKTGAIFLSAGLLNSSTWHRQTTEGDWKKFGAFGVGFNIQVQDYSK